MSSLLTLGDLIDRMLLNGIIALYQKVHLSKGEICGYYY